MKINNYEKSSFIYFCLSIYFCLLVIFIWWLINTKIYEYKKFNGIIINKEIVMILEERDLDYFYNNKHLFYNGNKYKFEITKITESLSFSDKKKIYELHLVSNLLKKNKINKEIIEVSLMVKRKSLINIFRIIWKEE